MDVADALKIALGIIGILVMTFCGVVWGELKKLRAQGHKHANRLAELGFAVGVLCQKIGISTKTYQDKDDE